MKKIVRKQKLVVAVEQVRELSIGDAALARVAGGMGTISIGCTQYTLLCPMSVQTCVG